MTQVYAKTINITNETYQNNADIISVDLNNCYMNNMDNSFYNCSNLTDVSNLNSDGTTMIRTFRDCYNLVNVTVIPNSVVDMSYTFRHTPIINAPVIPNTVINMFTTFEGCPNLTGDIIIHSNQITNAIDCFNRTTLTKDVYIPFTYQNGDNTLTYNSFINAGYDELGTTNGVYLKDLATYQN